MLRRQTLVSTVAGHRNSPEITETKQVCRCSLLSVRNVRWPRRVLPHGDLVMVSMPTEQTDGRTDQRQTDTLSFSLDAASVVTII